MPAHKARAIQTANVLQDARPKPADLNAKKDSSMTSLFCMQFNACGKSVWRFPLGGGNDISIIRVRASNPKS